MLRFAFTRARLRLASGLLVGLALWLLAPAEPAARVWLTLAATALAPWLVLGRDARRQREGWREAMARAPHAPLLVLAELLPAFTLLALVCVLAAGLKAGALLALWAGALVAVADALDRGAGAAAWPLALVGALFVATSPLWLAPFFGQTSAAPWLVSGAVALHPAGAALAAGGLPTLQDPLFYRFTLSGVVEARPLGWVWGATLFAGTLLIGAASAVRAAGRPSRRFA